MSFALTTSQLVLGQKTVTRRLGWAYLKEGDHLLAVEKSMGIPKGKKQLRLGVIEVVSVRREPLHLVTPEEVRLEGFPDGDVDAFLELFRRQGYVGLSEEVTRIEFRLVELFCVYCNGCIEPTGGGGPEYTIHRDGVGTGPELPLCVACGAYIYPHLEQIWRHVVAHHGGPYVDVG
jgi:hypothetical protein